MTVRTCTVDVSGRCNLEIDNGTFKLVHPITIPHFLQIWSPKNRRDGSRSALFRPVMSMAPREGREGIPIQRRRETQGILARFGPTDKHRRTRTVTIRPVLPI